MTLFLSIIIIQHNESQKVSRQINRYLRSSPCGPAEHCAGGSLPRSCNSCTSEQYHVYTSWETQYRDHRHVTSLLGKINEGSTYCSKQLRGYLKHPASLTMLIQDLSFCINTPHGHVFVPENLKIGT